MTLALLINNLTLNLDLNRHCSSSAFAICHLLFAIRGSVNTGSVNTWVTLLGQDIGSPAIEH